MICNHKLLPADVVSAIAFVFKSYKNLISRKNHKTARLGCVIQYTHYLSPNLLPTANPRKDFLMLEKQNR
ncbi:MAG: hypothetical protein sGL2_02430 [Candidatus Mesenet longicola]|nr:MAG: hypothetical protein sGL2_02430 [Candidatus Mesenet longicola]